IEDAVRYADLAGELLDAGAHELPFGIHSWPVGAYTSIGRPDRAAEFCRAHLARLRDSHSFTRGSLALALTISGPSDEAMGLADGLIDAAEATRNPFALCFALLAFGFAYGDTDPARAIDALRRGLAVAQDTGNQMSESHLAAVLCRVES